MNIKQFVVIAVITFFVGMVWLVTDIIFNTKASIPVSPKLQTLLEDVNPNFNERVLEQIEEETIERDIVPQSETTITQPEPQPQTQPVIESSPSAQLTL